MSELSIVRRNLLERPGYAPYCGAIHCELSWPRAVWDNEQFRCHCGWRSAFDAEFVAQYKAKRAEYTPPLPSPQEPQG